MNGPTASRPPQEQGDLFEERGTWCGPETLQQELGNENLDGLTDKELVEKTAQARLSNVDLLCAQIVDRGLGDIAVPGLVTLWNRFRGFGTVTPLAEQLLALETLSTIGTDAAKKEIGKIIAAHDLPDSLLPFVLQAAVKVGLILPQKQILPWLEYDAPTVRAQAFALIQSSHPQQSIFETGFSDPDPVVRRAALIAAGNLGHVSARAGLLAEFRKNPTSQTIKALLSIADDDIIVEVGRYALANQTYQAIIAEELEALENDKAHLLAKRINNQVYQR